MLEQLESRDMPSALGAVLPFVIDRAIVEKGLKNSGGWTSNFQTDFNQLQSDIKTFGPTNPQVTSDLSRTMADYGFAQQTFNLADNTVELAKAGLAFGMANGFFDQSDVVSILFSIRQIDSLAATTAAQKNTVNTLANTPFANGVSLGGSTTIASLSRAPYIP
ncbi:MAG TPA: hypothetical protein VH643_09850 [Gemmataceae bacterium]|jgi:hypothetical protein